MSKALRRRSSPRNRMDTKTIIRFENADLGYGAKPVLQDVSCSIQAGCSLGIVGPNGSGKTTFLRSVLGLLAPIKGTVFADQSRRFTYVPQAEEINLYLPMTVSETVFLAAKSARIFGKITQEEIHLAEEAMEKVGVSGIKNLLLRECSGGQRQKTILAQALSQKPDVLLLDEPTRGLDVVAERDLLALIRKLGDEQNISILFVTHSLHIPLNYMRELFLFDRGQVISTTPDELVRTKKLEEIYGAAFLHHEYNDFKWVMPLGGGK